jgi:hypothetical protein
LPVLLAILAAVAIWAQIRLAEAFARLRGERLLRLWREVASWRPTPTLAPAGFDAPDLQRSRAEVQGVAVDLAVHEATPPVTRVSAALPRAAPLFVVKIRRRGKRGAPLADDGTLKETKTGNRVFDGVFSLCTNDPDAARSLVDRRLAQLVSDFPRKSAMLCVDNNRCALSWAGTERDQGTMKLAIELVATACRRKA